MSAHNRIILSNENNVKGRDNERTGSEEVVILEVAETEDVVLELDLEVVDPITGDRIPERMPGSKPAVADVAGVSLSFAAVGGVWGVGGVGVVSKNQRDHIKIGRAHV